MFQLWSELRGSRGLPSMLKKLVKIIGNWAGQEDSKGGIWVLGRWQFTSPVYQWGRWLFHDGKRWEDFFQRKKGGADSFHLDKRVFWLFSLSKKNGGDFFSLRKKGGDDFSPSKQKEQRLFSSKKEGTEFFQRKKGGEDFFSRKKVGIIVFFYMG